MVELEGDSAQVRLAESGLGGEVRPGNPKIAVAHLPVVENKAVCASQCILWRGVRRCDEDSGPLETMCVFDEARYPLLLEVSHPNSRLAVQNVGPLFNSPERERRQKGRENKARRNQGMRSRFEPVVNRADGISTDVVLRANRTAMSRRNTMVDVIMMHFPVLERSEESGRDRRVGSSGTE
jgi:hypothetical protein